MFEGVVDKEDRKGKRIIRTTLTCAGGITLVMEEV